MTTWHRASADRSRMGPLAKVDPDGPIVQEAVGLLAVAVSGRYPAGACDRTCMCGGLFVLSLMTSGRFTAERIGVSTPMRCGARDRAQMTMRRDFVLPADGG